MSHYKPYPAYKDSGVEWLGQVPEHWDVAPFKWHIERNDGGVWGDDPDGDGDTVVLRSTEQTVDGSWKLDDPAVRKLTEAERRSALLVTGDLLVTKSSGSALHIGKTTLVNSEVEALSCCYSNFMQRIRTKATFAPKLTWFVMNNDLARRQFELLSNTTTGLANLNGTMIGQILVAVPPLEEQAAILQNLDRETARIDALVAKKTRFIELLREKRQALITHAVTKGLDPNVKMKDSGVEWLGEVPEHWDVKAIRWLSPVQRGASPRPIDDPVYFDDDGEYGWVRIEDVTASDGFLEETKQRLSELGSSLSVKLSPGALFLSIAGSVGKPCITRIKACIHDGFVYFPLLKTDPMWLVRIFESRSPFVGLGKLGTQLNLNTETVGSIKVALPPAGEISEILSDLDRCLAHLGQLISRTEHSITLLKERRSALITAAVTGQIDLREAV